MDLVLDQVSCCLKQASRSLSAGQVEQVCAQLAQAGSILDGLIINHVTVVESPTVIKKSQQSEAPQALTMIA